MDETLIYKSSQQGHELKRQMAESSPKAIKHEGSTSN